MKSQLQAILIAAVLGAGAASLHAQSDAYINSVLADTKRMIAESQRHIQETRKSQGLPPLTGDYAKDSMTMLREQQAAFYRHMENIKRCSAGDQRACAEADRYEAAQRRTTRMLGAVTAGDQIRNSVNRHQYEQNWRKEYDRAKANEYYYDKVRKNEALKKYWQDQAEAYKPPYGK